MFCENCGSPIKDTDTFCMNCGNPVEPAKEGQEQPAQEVQSAEETQGEQAQAEQAVQETAEEPVAQETAESTPVQEAVQETQPAPEVQPQQSAQPSYQAAQNAYQPAQNTYQTAQSSYQTSQNAYQTSQASYQGAQTSYGGASAYGTPMYGGVAGAAAQPPKKKSKLPLILGIVAAVVVVVGVVCALNAKAVNNFFHKTFSDPEEYYQWVEGQSVKDVANSAGQLYTNYFLSMTDIYDKSASGEVNIELGEEGSDLLSLAGLAGVDLSWIKNASMTYSISNVDGYVSGDLSASLNKNQILSGSMILDVDDQMLYAQVPELSKTWLGFSEDVTGFSGYDADAYFDAMDELKKNAKSYPSQQEIETLVEKYYGIVIGCIKDVDMDSTTIEAEDVEQKCTELEVTIDKSTMEKIAKAVSKSVEKDKDLEKLIKKMAPLIDEDMDPDDLYDDFKEGLLDELDNMTMNEDDEIVMKVYVNSKGKVIGRTFETEDYWGDKIKIASLMPQKGSQFGYELSYSYDRQSVKLTGSGKRAKDKITGDFNVKYNGTKLLNIQVTDFDLASAKSGYLNGKFSITPDKKFSSLLEDSYYNYYYNMDFSWLQDLKVDITSEMSQNTSKVEISATMDKDSLGTISISANQGKGKKPSIPSGKDLIEVEDEDDMMDYLEDVDWDALLDKLEKSKMPSEMLDIIEDALDNLEYYYY